MSTLPSFRKESIVNCSSATSRIGPFALFYDQRPDER